jgi:hypothetical protein
MAADEAVAIETRAAPPAVSGANQTGVRLYNERLVLSLMRRHRQLSKIEVARQTGLSVQTASAILNHLHEDGLLRRETPLRGKVGQPTVPFSLDPEGAFAAAISFSSISPGSFAGASTKLAPILSPVRC